MMQTGEKKFLHFSFGSNLLTERIHMNTPSAIRRGIGKLKDYRLDFDHWAKRWNGCVPTVVPEPGSCVWGAIWELDSSDLPNLDRQGGVANYIYKAVNLAIESGNETLICRCYLLCEQPKKIPDEEMVPENRKPSLLYLDVMIRGAVESRLPENYISQLKKVEHNGWNSSKIRKIMVIDDDVDT